jgi:integrase
LRPRKTIAQAAQDYMNTLEAKRTTHISYENILNQYWMPTIGDWPAKEVTTNKLKDVLAALTVSSKTKKNILIPIKGVLDHAGIRPNPASGITFKKQQKPIVERYTPEQRDKLLNALQGQCKLYFAILFGCGLRPGEALALQWSDYDGSELNISKQITKRRLEPSTKTNIRRAVYAPSWVRSLLNEHPTRFEGEYIFVNTKGGPYLDTDVFNAQWKAAHKKARAPYRIPYTCRHTRAAELLSTGIGPADAAKQMGHSVEMFLRIYSEYIEEFSKDQDRSRFEGMGPSVVNLSPKLKTEKVHS